MKKLLSALAAVLIFFSACKEDSLVTENPAPPADNLRLTLLPFYGSAPVNFDSIYTNQLGIQFYIDSVGLLVSDVIFHRTDSDEKVDTAKNWVHLNHRWPNGRSGSIPAGGYQGEFEVRYGGDSTYADYLQEITALNPSLIRNDGLGVNFFTIKARVFDPALPPTDSVFIPVQYTLGTYLLADTAISEVRYFSVDFEQEVPIFLLADLKPILHYVNMAILREVNSDLFDNQDWTVSELMRDSLSIGIF